LLFKVWDISSSRMTRDIDTLAKISNSIVNFKKKIFSIICEVSIDLDDGIIFESF
jgi:hypothetical protein